jgi:hypothetical protein
MSSSLSIVFLKQILSQLSKGNTGVLKQVKYFQRWKKSLTPGISSMSDRQPWLTFQAIDYLRKSLNRDSVVFEYGGGGSTLFFIDHAGTVKTVEHDEAWFLNLEHNILTNNSTNWKGSLILPENKSTTEELNPGNPEHYFSADENFTDKLFKAYASEIDKYADNTFDFVLVDGRVRPSCIMHSVEKIKSGGYLIVDNSDRKYYFEFTGSILQKHFIKVFDEMALSPYANFLTKTGIWKKR